MQYKHRQLSIGSEVKAVKKDNYSFIVYVQNKQATNSNWIDEVIIGR